MDVIAKARFIRMSPRKVRLVIDLIRGLSVNDALVQLRYLRKDAVAPVRKLIESATSNAEHNFKLKKENLYIKKIIADGGPMLKRWQPRAHGRATPIRKRTCHITAVLDEMRRGVVNQAVNKVEKISASKKVSSLAVKSKVVKSPQGKFKARSKKIKTILKSK
jgi:large subunit ribosomal protein L22